MLGGAVAFVRGETPRSTMLLCQTVAACVPSNLTARYKRERAGIINAVVAMAVCTVKILLGSGHTLIQKQPLLILLVRMKNKLPKTPIQGRSNLSKERSRADDEFCAVATRHS
jgi:hypothetical protein